MVGTVLAVEHLTVRYGGVVAVSDVDLHVDAGKVVGLIGPNGAGKTSLIDAVTGFARAEGAVVLHGERIDGLKAHTRVRRGLARTFQALELYDDLTVEENVSAALFGTARDHRHGQVAAALDRVGLSELAEREAGELSQGERQLVSIARACACDPTRAPPRRAGGRPRPERHPSASVSGSGTSPRPEPASCSSTTTSASCSTSATTSTCSTSVRSWSRAMPRRSVRTERSPTPTSAP